MSFVSTNWAKLQQRVPKRQRTSKPDTPVSKQSAEPAAVNAHNRDDSSHRFTSVVAMDCEFVGVGENGTENALARCSVVNGNGDVLYDKYVRSVETVVDFRTAVSGIRYEDVNSSHAIDFKQCQQDVSALLKNKILVGHSIKHDLEVLLLSHPRQMIRDTAHCKLLCPVRPRPLRVLVKERLGNVIQDGEHSSVEDARAVLQLYKSIAREWEKQLRKRGHKLNKADTVVKSTASASGAMDAASYLMTADFSTSARNEGGKKLLQSLGKSAEEKEQEMKTKVDKRTRAHMNNLGSARSKAAKQQRSHAADSKANRKSESSFFIKPNSSNSVQAATSVASLTGSMFRASTKRKAADAE